MTAEHSSVLKLLIWVKRYYPSTGSPATVQGQSCQSSTCSSPRITIHCALLAGLTLQPVRKNGLIFVRCYLLRDSQKGIIIPFEGPVFLSGVSAQVGKSRCPQALSVHPATVLFISSKSPKIMCALKCFILEREESNQNAFKRLSLHSLSLHETSLLPLAVMSGWALTTQCHQCQFLTGITNLLSWFGSLLCVRKVCQQFAM